MAIAFDAITSNTATPTSFSHTVTGSNPVLVALVAGDPASMTYGGVSLTRQVGVLVPVAGDPLSCWTLLNPATGANTLASSGGTAPVGVQAVSYTGVGALSGANSDTAGNPTTITFTVGVANSLIVCSGYGRNGPHALAASTGVVNDRYGLTTSGICSAGDSGLVSSNTSISWSNAGSPNPGDTASVGIVLEPAASSAIKTINGLAKASVKTVNGLAIASVKTWNGLA